MSNQHLVVPSAADHFNSSQRAGLCLGILLAIAAVSQAWAQGLPTAQPKILTVIREHVKVGRSADHAKFEAGYPAAFAKAKSPQYYLAVTSLTGPSEAWYLISNDSYAAVGESMKRDDKDPVLSAELARLDLGDAEFIQSVEVIRAASRPELSLGTFPDLAKMRFFEITTFRIRPGHEQQFEDVAKAYASALKRVAPKTSYRVYEVLAGMAQPTYLIFSSVENYGEFDQMLRDSQALFKDATAEEKSAFQKWSEAAEGVENNHFRLDPGQSYVPKETRDKDPEFWMPK